MHQPLKYIALLLSMVSCTYNYIELEETPDLVSYEHHVQPIFSNNCIACHNGNYAYPNLNEGFSFDALIYGNYIDTTTLTSSKLIIKINDQHYGGTLSSSEIDIITKWIEEGALNN